MSRLFLEICSEPASDHGTPTDLPPIVICSAEDQAATVRRAIPGAQPLILRRHDGGGYALEPPAGGDGSPMEVGQWHTSGGWKLRVARGDEPEESPHVSPARPAWAAPELRVTTYDGERVKRLRCVLPVEEAAELVVGRGGTKADLVVEDEHVSRVHLRFFVLGGKQLIEDLGSRWGTTLNGEALSGPRPLAHGDEIRLGKSTIQYVCLWEVLPCDEGLSAAGASIASQSIVREEPVVGDESPSSTVEQDIVKASDSTGGDEVKSQAVAEAKVTSPPSTSGAQTKPTIESKPLATGMAGLPAAWTSITLKPPNQSGTKRNITGFDVGGAIVLVGLLLAGIAYLAWRVFGH